MIKTEELPLVCFKDGKVYLKEREGSLEEWDHIRTAAFATLRKDGFIPSELLDLVEGYDERTLVTTYFRKTPDGAGLRPEIRLKNPKKKLTVRLAEILAERKRIFSSDREKPTTASETLAFFLRILLRQLKYEEKKRNAAPARTLRLVPRSVIAEVAVDLLNSCATWNYPPGSILIELIRELLNIEGHKHEAPRQWDAQEKAAQILAQIPTIPTRELARHVKVNPSTVSRSAFP